MKIDKNAKDRKKKGKNSAEPIYIKRTVTYFAKKKKMTTWRKSKVSERPN